MEVTSIPLKFNAGFVQLDNYLKKDKDLKEDEFSAGVMNFGRFGGKTWALPAVTGGINLYYNKQVFDGAGVKYPTDTWTWDDLFDAAKKLTKGEGEDKIYGGPMAVVHVPTMNGWLARSGGGVFDEKENVILDKAETIAGLQAYADLIQRHRVSATADELMYRPRDDPKFSPWSDYVGQFRRNKLAMFVLGDHGRATLSKATDMTAGWDYVMLPAVKAGLPPKTPATGSINGILRNSKNPDAAYQALRQLSLRDIQLAIVEDGRVPVLKAALNHASFMSFGNKNNKIFLQRQYIPGNRDVPGGGDWEGQVTPDLTAFLEGKFTAKAFVDKQTPILKQLRAKYDQKK
jgi:multiple sugar transport system substrate-binding protein